MSTKHLKKGKRILKLEISARGKGVLPEAMIIEACLDDRAALETFNKMQPDLRVLWLSYFPQSKI